jgi:hypothetical protein
MFLAHRTGQKRTGPPGADWATHVPQGQELGLPLSHFTADSWIQ